MFQKNFIDKKAQMSVELVIGIVVALMILAISAYFILNGGSNLVKAKDCRANGGYYEVNCNPKFAVELGGFGKNIDGVVKKCCVSNDLNVEEFNAERDTLNTLLDKELAEKNKNPSVKPDEVIPPTISLGAIKIKGESYFRNNVEYYIVNSDEVYNKSKTYYVYLTDPKAGICSTNISHYPQRIDFNTRFELNSAVCIAIAVFNGKNLERTGYFKIEEFRGNSFIIEDPKNKACSLTCNLITTLDSANCNNFFDRRQMSSEEYISCVYKLNCMETKSNVCKTCEKNFQTCMNYQTDKSCAINQCAVTKYHKCYWNAKETACYDVINCDSYDDKSSCKNNPAKLETPCEWKGEFLGIGKGCEEVKFK
jgi:hypothetical protein